MLGKLYGTATKLLTLYLSGNSIARINIKEKVSIKRRVGGRGVRGRGGGGGVGGGGGGSVRGGVWMWLGF